MRKLYGKVSDREIKLQSAFAGVQGEAGATALVLSFTADWAHLGKRLVFLNSHHENPVAVLLGVDRLYGDDPFTYIVPIPGEALEFPGDALLMAEATEEGSGKLIRTLTTAFRVSPAPTGTLNPMEEDEALQLQAQLDSIRETLMLGLSDAELIGNYAKRAENAAEEAEEHAGVALAASRNCILASGDHHAACYQGKITVPILWEEQDSVYVCDIPTERSLSTDALWLFIPREKQAIAEQMGLFACESRDGFLRLFAAKAPSESFTADYTLMRGVILL